MTFEKLEQAFGAPIAQRDNAGIRVALFYKHDDHDGNEFQIFYADAATNFSASFDVPQGCVWDAWTHPYVYARAAMHGKPLAAVSA